MLKDVAYSVCVAFAGFLVVWLFTDPYWQARMMTSAHCEPNSSPRLVKVSDTRSETSCDEADLSDLLAQVAALWDDKPVNRREPLPTTQDLKPSIHGKAASAAPTKTVHDAKPDASAAPPSPMLTATSQQDSLEQERAADRASWTSAARRRVARPRQKPDLPLFASLGGALSENEIGRITAVEDAAIGMGSAGVDATLSYEIISRRFKAPAPGNQEQAMIPSQVTPIDLSVLQDFTNLAPGDFTISETSVNN